MRVIVPNELTLLSCSVAETDATDGTVWNATTAYSLNAKVRHNHVSYSSLSNDNKGMNPADSWSGALAAWKKLGATTPYRMIDAYVETQTSSNGNLSFRVPYNSADSFALLNLTGEKARIRIYDNDDPEDPVFFDETISLIEDIFHLSLWEYNYLPIVNIRNYAKTDMPQIVNGELFVEIYAAGDRAAVGHVVVGRGQELGWTRYGAELGFTDYSRKNVDEFGVVTLVRRSYAHRAILPVYLHPDQMDYVASVLAGLRGMPALWIGDNSTQGHSSLTIYGWLEDFRMTCEGPNENQLTLEVQGLI